MDIPKYGLTFFSASDVSKLIATLLFRWSRVQYHSQLSIAKGQRQLL